MKGVRSLEKCHQSSHSLDMEILSQNEFNKTFL